MIASDQGLVRLVNGGVDIFIARGSTDLSFGKRLWVLECGVYCMLRMEYTHSLLYQLCFYRRHIQ